MSSLRSDESTTGRTRGFKKKERTRNQLIAAAIDAIAAEGEAFSVLDVTRRAEVSNGTFYNYFDDRDALIDALVAEVLTTFTATSAAIVDVDEPARRFATISALVLRHAAESPRLAGVLLRLETMTRSDQLDNEMFGYLRDDITRGVAAGRFDYPPSDAVVDLVIGALMRAVRRITDGEHGDDEYRQETIGLLLRALGVEAAEAEELATEAVAAAPTLPRAYGGAERSATP